MNGLLSLRDGEWQWLAAKAEDVMATVVEIHDKGLPAGFGWWAYPDYVGNQPTEALAKEAAERSLRARGYT